MRNIKHLISQVLKQQGGNKKNKIENTFLYKFPTRNLEKFYTYQYFNYNLQESKTEWDSLIIIPEHRAIINIEVKLGPNEKGDKLKLLKDASEQTKQHFSFMQKLFGVMLSKDWVFVRAACVPYLEIVEGAKIPCVNCQQFILHDVNDVSPWLKQIMEHKLVTSNNHDQTVYENLVTELIYHISIKESSRFNQLISDRLTISKEVEKALTGHSDGISIDNNVPVYMLNNEQLQAVHSTANFLIIDGDYGTGKTYVLKERAKKCATENCKDQIIYIDLTTITIDPYEEVSLTSHTSVMDEMARVEFKSYPNVRVITIKDLIEKSLSYILYIIDVKPEEIMYSINHFLKDNLCDHLFIDEMIFERLELPSSMKTICMSLKVDIHDNRDYSTTKREEWIKAMKKHHNALCFNLTKNMRNSFLLHKFSEAFYSQSSPTLPDNNVIGSHIYYYHNIYGISSSLLACAVIKKYFFLEPHEGVVVLTTSFDITNKSSIFDMLNKEFSSTRPVVSDLKEYMNKPEVILVTNFWEFQGAQARNIIIIANFGGEGDNVYMRNMILRAMSFAIVISYHKPSGNNLEAIEDKNLHDFIYAQRISVDCHHYHNKDKHDICAITMAILDKYKLLDQDEGIVIVTCKRISKNIMKKANTKKFLNLTVEEREEQVDEKIRLENKELFEELKRNISRKYDEISWSYYDCNVFNDLENKPRHINFMNITGYFEFVLNEARNVIIWADENIDHKHRNAASGDNLSLDYSDDETSIKVDVSQMVRYRCEALSRDIICEAQPKFAIIVHDGDLQSFSHPKEALNLIEDDNLHKYIPEEIKKRKNCSIL